MTTRGSTTRQLWRALWFFWLAVILQQILLDARFGAPAQLLILQVLPLVIAEPYLVFLCFAGLFCVGGAGSLWTG